jgi:hypothetical protein
MPLFITSLILYFFSLAWLSLHGPTGNGGWLFIAAYLLSFAGMLGIWHWWPQHISRNIETILLIALISRGFFIPYPASDDVNRYVWEGRIQNFGFNPYTTPPSSPELSNIRTDYWSDINHKDVPAVYGPAAQLLFKGLSYFSESLLAYKIVFIGFDIATMLVLIMLLRFLAVPIRHTVLYAFNPLVILFISGEGHVESIPIFFILLALYLLIKRKDAWAFLMVGCACMCKWNYALLFPFFIRPGNMRHMFFLVVPILTVFLYAVNPLHLLEVPVKFGTQSHYNGLLFTTLKSFLDVRTTVDICYGVLFFASGTIFLLTPNPLRAVFLGMGCFLFCSPTVHPWYLMMIVPLFVLYRSPGWLVWFSTISITFFTIYRCIQTGVWAQADWQIIAEYLPVISVFLILILSKLKSDYHTYLEPLSVSVIIPVLNEIDTIDAVLQSVIKQTRKPDKIIVVDGGSTDGTIEKASSFSGVQVIQSGKGRGTQIAAGVQVASSDILLILHADSIVAPQALSRMVAALEKAPSASGGSFSAVYNNTSFKYRLIEMLNNARAGITGISFGDQAQFFRKEAVSVPDYMLMEDVELAFRIKEAGTVLFIPNGVVSSTRRWQKQGYLLNFFRVIFLTLSFIFLRRFWQIRDHGDWYYQAYYGKQTIQS